jgi:NAD(P)H-dependent FMN reductase
LRRRKGVEGNPFGALLARKATPKERVASFDGYVFVTPEYNHGTSAALKNAIDYLSAEWNNKAAGFVSYGAVSGARAVEHLRTVMGNLMVADVTAQVMLSLFTDFENMSVFRPHPRHEAELHSMLDQVIAWAGALTTLRSAKETYRQLEPSVETTETEL